MSGNTQFRRLIALLLAASAALFMPSCADQPDREPTLAEAFVAPSTLQIRGELVSGAPLAATLKHGDRVEIVGRRRRFFKIRTASGAVGWADSVQFLSTRGMDHLRDLSLQTGQAPSQGQATVFDVLNVHTAPNRQAPTIFQIQPGAKVEVIAHELAPRVPYNPPAPLLPALETPKAVKKKKKREPEVPPPPRPEPPAPPSDWVRMSARPAAEPRPAPPSAAPQTAKPAAVDELWTLVRARDGVSGWVLARMIFMALPDEVTQYAERARIAAYFHVGDSTGRSGLAQPAWLWATSSRPREGFDSLRLFTWNSRRNRYETAYIERNLTGLLPIIIQRDATGAASGFTAVVSEKDGALQTRVYALNALRVRLASRRPATVPRRWYTQGEISGLASSQTQPPPPTPAWRDKIPSWVPLIGNRPSR
ncbi:MAG: hypothetical protein C0504_07025 [Candidatus Solibacter sp.]|nr:hypothetical protein [Candidatus Solibacter sp.]